MTGLFKTTADSAWFQHAITGVIIAAGIVVGVQTYPVAVRAIGGVLEALDYIILAIFAVEIIVKMGAEGRKPWRYFGDPWNVFDFTIVVVCFLPLNAHYMAVLRLARLLRVLKLVRALPKLQILVNALLKSIPSMGYVALLLGLLFYVYSVAAVFLFGPNDPVHFDDLPIAMLSLFRVVTAEDWTDVMYINMYGCENYGYEGIMELCTQSYGYPIFAALFFVSFMLLGAMVILNLFIGVIMGGMEEAKAENEMMEREERRRTGKTNLVSEDIDLLVAQMSKLQQELFQLQLRVRTQEEAAQAGGDPGVVGVVDGGGT